MLPCHFEMNRIVSNHSSSYLVLHPALLKDNQSRCHSYFRLAANARNFGASYLRLEDYYCYAASALEAVAEVTAPSALIPFDPKPVFP